MSASSANPAGGGDEAAGYGGLGMQGGGGRAADGNGTPADVSRTLGRESESRKRKAAVVPTETVYLMGNEGDFNVPSEDCYRISKEIENLRSQLALKKKELKCYQQNKKLRVELDLKVKEVECLRKENEELKAQNKDLQKNIVEILDSQIESKKRHLQQSEHWRKRLELSNAQLEEEIKNLYEGNSEETHCLMSHQTCSNVLKATLEDEVHNLKSRDDDHLKETRDLWKQVHGCDQEVVFSERHKSLEIEMITKNDEIDKLCNDLTTKCQGKALIEKSCAAILESFESKSTAAIKALADAVKSYVMALLSEGYKIEASSNVAADLSPSSILEAQTSDAKIQIKALFSQLLSLTQQVVGADSIQAKDAELATQKEAIKSLKAYLGEESYSNKKDFCQHKIEDGEKLEKVLRATKARLKAISAEKETAEESLKVVQAELEANKSSLAQALSDRDSARQVTGKMKEDITELMNEAGTISASLVLAVFKDHYPDLDVSVINKGFQRYAVKAQELIESFKDLVQPVMKQLEFSYWSDDEDSLSS